MTGAPTRSEHMRALTGLRFIAAAAVVGVHLDYWFAFTGPVHNLTRNGSLGVTFFFVLSGFVLTASHRPGSRAREFYRRRVARVYPLHVVTWTTALLLFPIAFTATRWEYLSGLVMLHGFGSIVGHQPLLNLPAWSLTCEAFFYALFPVLVVRVGRLSPSGLKAGILACWVVSAATLALSFALLPGVYADQFTTGMPPLRLTEFLAGMMLARLVHIGWRPTTVQGWVSALSGSVVLVTDWPQMLRALLVLPAVLVLIGWAARSEHSWLTSRVMVRLGQQSYALFLSHAIVIPLLAMHLAGSVLQLLVIELGTALFVAAVLHHGVEVPLERRLRGSERTRDRRPRLEVLEVR